MNDRIPLDEDRSLPDGLRWQLRAMRRDAPPPADLWPSIAARLETPHGARAPRIRLHAKWLALAASVVVAVTAGVIVTPRAGEAREEIALRESRQLTREYDRAQRAMPEAPPPTALAPGLAVLDRTARELRHALVRDPDSRLLLDQLRRTYSLRLALSQRAVVG